MKFAIRLIGTIVFTIVTAGLYGAGLFLLGTMLVNTMPAAAYVPAMLGLIAAPPMLFADMLRLLRDEDAAKAEKE